MVSSMKRFLTVTALVCSFSLLNAGCGGDSGSTRLNARGGAAAVPGAKKVTPGAAKTKDGANPAQGDQSQSDT
jgi:hypothetical protein